MLLDSCYVVIYLDSYLMIKAMKADAAKSNAIRMVALNNVFSRPRLVWNMEVVPPSPPPSAPPTSDPDRCNKIAPISKTERTICAQGRIFKMSSIWMRL